MYAVESVASFALCIEPYHMAWLQRKIPAIKILLPLFFSLSTALAVSCCRVAKRQNLLVSIVRTRSASVPLHGEQRRAAYIFYGHVALAHLMLISFDSFNTQINAGNVRNEFVGMKINVNGINFCCTASYRTRTTVGVFFFRNILI